MSARGIELLLAPGGLAVSFQPIFECSAEGTQLHALEGLVRGPHGSNLARADVLFDYVRRKREEIRLDRACVLAILESASGLRDASIEVSFNVHATTLACDPGFLDFVVDAASAHGLHPGRLILEIVEHGPEWAGRDLLRALDALREAGLRIALDDVGLGQSNYRMIVDCRPDYFKLDRYFVSGAAGDFRRLAVIESVAQLAAKFGARVVAEGVETAQDLAVVVDRGVELVQGHLFSPAVPPARVGESVRSATALLWGEA